MSSIKKIKRIDPKSLAKIQMFMMGIFGLFIGLSYGLAGLALGGAATDSGDVLAGLGLLAIVLVPVFYGVIGWVFGYIGALIWNAGLKWTGGLSIEIEG